MPFDPDEHHRRSIRLRGFDYAAPGGYYLTIGAQQRACRFGDVVDYAVRLNALGMAVAEAWLSNRYPHIARHNPARCANDELHAGHRIELSEAA